MITVDPTTRILFALLEICADTVEVTSSSLTRAATRLTVAVDWAISVTVPADAIEISADTAETTERALPTPLVIAGLLITDSTRLIPALLIDVAELDAVAFRDFPTRLVRFTTVADVADSVLNNVSPRTNVETTVVVFARVRLTLFVKVAV